MAAPKSNVSNADQAPEFTAKVFVMQIPLSKLGNAIVENIAHRIREHNTQFYYLLGMEEPKPELIAKTVNIFYPGKNDSDFFAGSEVERYIEPSLFAIVATEGIESSTGMPFVTRDSLFGISHEAFRDLIDQPQDIDMAGSIMDFVKNILTANKPVKDMALLEGKGFVAFYKYGVKPTYRNAQNASRGLRMTVDVPFYYCSDVMAFIEKHIEDLSTIEVIDFIQENLNRRHSENLSINFLSRGRVTPITIPLLIEMMKPRFSPEMYDTLRNVVLDFELIQSTYHLLSRHQRNINANLNQLIQKLSIEEQMKMDDLKIMD